jgi:hypothetical protein
MLFDCRRTAECEGVHIYTERHEVPRLGTLLDVEVHVDGDGVLSQTDGQVQHVRSTWRGAEEAVPVMPPTQLLHCVAIGQVIIQHVADGPGLESLQDAPGRTDLVSVACHAWPTVPTSVQYEIHKHFFQKGISYKRPHEDYRVLSIYGVANITGQ